jgi:hypothetical protein
MIENARFTGYTSDGGYAKLQVSFNGSACICWLSQILLQLFYITNAPNIFNKQNLFKPKLIYFV